MKYFIIILSILLIGCASNTPYIIVNKESYIVSYYSGIAVVLWEYSYFTENNVKVYHYTKEQYNVGDTLKSNTIKKASRKDHLLF